MEAFLSAPAAFDRAKLRSIAASALLQFGEYGLRPNQIWQRLGDQLFDYELWFTLFNNQAQFRFGSERLFMSIQNARGQRDAQLLVDCLVRASTCLGGEKTSKASLQAHSHAVFENEESCSAFFAPFVDSAQGIVGGGRIVLVQEKDRSTHVRLAVEKSTAFKDAVFVTWSTECMGSPEPETLRGIVDRFNNSVQKLGLEICFE